MRPNFLLATNCLLIFFALVGERLTTPLPFQIFGRLHPAALHFPIVLLIVSAVLDWEKNQSQPQVSPLTARRSLKFWAALSAAVVALMGIFLEKEGGFDAEILKFHRFGGVATSLLAWAWWAFSEKFSEIWVARRAMIFALLASVFWTGHFGASLTHGSDFLWQPLEKSTAQNFSKNKNVSLDSALVFENLVLPILHEKCRSCHNAQKMKGDLNLETAETLKRGGKNGQIFDPAAADFGEMMRRIHLPDGEKKRMPPAGKPQLLSSEIQILEQWLRRGANFSEKISDLPAADPLRKLAADFLKNDEPSEIFDFAAADAASLEKLKNPNFSVQPISENSPALAVNFLSSAGFRPEFLEELAAVKTQIVELNLGRMPVGDAEILIISEFKNLQKLNLSATKITGAGLSEALKNLKSLRQLSLSQTAVKISDLDFLADLPNLKTVFLWQTAVAQSADFEILRQRFPKIRFENGFDGAGIVAKLNAPVIETERDVFQNFTKVRLKNYVAGAQVRYTLDGSAVDSLTSPLAGADSILVERTCLLRAKIFLENWVSSDEASRQFYKIGAAADSITLVFQPNERYRSRGARVLIDQKLGDDVDFSSKNWLGFREQPCEAWLFFRSPTLLSAVTFGGLWNLESYIFPPASLEIWGGPDKNHLQILKKTRPPQPSQLGEPPRKLAFTLDFPAQRVQVLKIVAHPVERLPAWHPGKGERGWVFLEEFFLN